MKTRGLKESYITLYKQFGHMNRNNHVSRDNIEANLPSNGAKMNTGERHVLYRMCLVFCVVMIVVSCDSKKEEWQGEIIKQNGTTIVKNPQEPYYGEMALEIEENLTVGNEEDPNYQFYRVAGIALDSQSNLYVLDSGNNRVQKFDDEGNYLLSIGREGQGPGEFERISSVFIDDKDTIYVSDQRRIQIFSSAGEYQESITFENGINEFFIDVDGNIMTHIIQNDEEGSRKYLVKYNRDGEIVQKIDEFSDVQAVRSQDSEGRTVAFKAYHQYNYWPYIFPITDRIFIYTYPSEYAMTVMSNTGEVTLRIEKEEPPHSISNAEKDFIINRIEERASQMGRKPPRDVLEASCQFPPHRPFFHGIFVDKRGRIYIRRSRSVLDESDQVAFDIFSEDGYYLYNTLLPFSPDLTRGDRFYDIFTSEETGEVKIKRYRIKNWDQIKAGI
jgi:hypothetical protein